jgi:DNA polymerase III delta prime subunit
MKKFIANIWNKIKDLYNSLIGTSKKYIPIAINIVEAIKKVTDSPVDDIILSIVKAAIPGTADDVMIDKVKDTVEKWLPKILLELRLWQSVSNIEDQNEQLQAILKEINLSSDETKSIIYHGLAALILEKLSDGELSWSDSVAISEYYFKNIHKK